VNNIFCIDNHYKIGGLGDRIAATISSFKNLNINQTFIGLDEVPACGSNDEIMSFHGLDSQSIFEKIKSVMR